MAEIIKNIENESKEYGLNHIFLGRDAGDFSSKNQSREEFLNKVKNAFERLPESVSKIYSPIVSFTNRVVEFKNDHNKWNEWFLRTQTPADGAIIEELNTAITIFNGDCPIICLREGKKLAVLHGGYRCLIRQDKKEKGIIENAMQYFDPKKTNAFVFGGIGPCCWVPEDDKPEVLSPEISRYPDILAKCIGKTNENSPLGPSRISVDLYKLTRELLIMQNIPESQFKEDATCTCHVQKDGKPVFWSHTRFLGNGQNGIDGRNMAIVWLEQH